MTVLRKFSKGDVLFHQGDGSDCVLRLRAGEIEVLREVGATSVLLGSVGEGEWLGEMGVVENRRRSATARATASGEVEILTAQHFLNRVSSDPALARDLILRLSVRLRKIDDRLAGNLAPLTQDWSRDSPGEKANAVIADDAKISLRAETDFLRARIGSAAIDVVKLPFLVGQLQDESAQSYRRGLSAVE